MQFWKRRRFLLATLVLLLVFLGVLRLLRFRESETLRKPRVVEKRDINYNNRQQTVQYHPVEDSTRVPMSAACEFYRYQDVQLHKDTPANVAASHAFINQALAEALNPQNDCQVILGRNAVYENRIMYYPTRNYPKPLKQKWYINPGFYFTTEETDEEKLKTVKQWAEAWSHSFTGSNLFGVWDWEDPKFITMQMAMDEFAPRAGRLHTDILYPPCFSAQKLAQWDTLPWTSQLHNKTVLIVHPFVDSIRSNQPRLHDIWASVADFTDPNHCFPRSTRLKFIRPPMHQAESNHSQLIPWMDVLADLKEKIDAVGHFDIALLGCGGFGMPLVHHISQLPHKPSAMYIGGALQLFFGILGGRWVTGQYLKELGQYFNDAWTWPLSSDVGNSSVDAIENSAYVKPVEGSQD